MRIDHAGAALLEEPPRLRPSQLAQFFERLGAAIELGKIVEIAIE
jgi:hypothetical protein